MNSDLAPFATLTTLREALRAKRLSATELTQFYLRRIAADETNSFITVCAEQAQAEARRADAEIARNGQRDLLGLPIAHKDAFCTDGVRTTCASKMLADFVAPYDATAVANLKAAGAITLGKTNMDEFAVGSSNETSHFGSVANPWDANRVPGGSSGGSAAAVAAGLVPAATATDTGGSIRQPATFCGVSGLKPTYGRISRFGLVAFASSLDQGGAIARSAADLRLVLRGMEGHDPRDSTSVDMPPTPASGESGVAQALRIGVPTEYCANLHADVAAALNDAAAILERLGHRRQEITLPHTAYACAVYYVISGAEASSNLARYDGVRYGHRTAKPASLDELYKRSRSEGFGTEVKRRILTGAYALSAGYYDAYYKKAQCLRRLIRQDFLDAFQNVDLILAPSTPTPAFERGRDRELDATYKDDALTIPASLSGLPGLSVPCGFAGRLPVGMQFIGPHFAEDRLLTLAETFQRETDWHLRTP